MKQREAARENGNKQSRCTTELFSLVLLENQLLLVAFIVQSVGFKLHPPGEKSAISSFLLTYVEDWLTDDCDVLKYDRLGSAPPQFWPKFIIFSSSMC